MVFDVEQYRMPKERKRCLKGVNDRNELKGVYRPGTARTSVSTCPTIGLLIVNLNCAHESSRR